jgi:LysR family glycine cleavage system transcriptional activator
MVMSNLRSRLPPLGALAAFEAACRHGSFTRAARELNLTQAAVSRQIRALEQYLGVDLFERRRHDVVITPEGERFARTVNPALSAIGDATTALKSGDQAELIIFAELCLGAHWLMPRLSRFQATHPALSLNIHTSNRPIETESEPFDVALSYGVSNHPAFVSEPIGPERILAVCSPAARKRLPRRCGAKDLAAADLIHFEHRGSDWIDWRQFLDAFGARPRRHPRLVFNTYNSAIDAALEGHGVVLGWGHVVKKPIADGRLVAVGDLAIDSPDPLSAHIPTNRARHPAVPAFIAWLRSEMAA